MPYICNYTNINLNSKVIVFDTSKTSNRLKEIMIPYLFSKIDINLKNNKDNENIIIYIDEIWKYISLSNNQNIESIIYSLYKSIRKNKASIVSITQDITDLFMYQKGSFGKSILNNSAFKVFFKLEFADSEILKKLNIIDDKILNEMSRLDKKMAIITLNNNIVTVNIKSSDIERKIILGKKDEDFSSS